MKRVLCSIAAGLTMLGLFWLGGFDFNERGSAALACAYFTLVTAGATYFFPGWKE